MPIEQCGRVRGGQKEREITLQNGPSKLRHAMRLIAAIGFAIAGVQHFRKPEFFERIVPSIFPSPKWLVIISGACEIAGGLGLLHPRLRKPAAYGLIALLVAVFPANLYMAMNAERFRDVAQTWMLWVRLPLQPVMIAWVYFARGNSGSQEVAPAAGVV